MYRVTTIRLALLCILLALIVSIRGDAQTIDHPQPQHPRPRWDFYTSNAYMLGAMVADERMSVHGIRAGCAVEGNPIFRTRSGGINSGKYYATNLSLAAVVIGVSYVVTRYGRRSREGRLIMDAASVAAGTPHLVAALQWVRVCSP